MNELIFIVEPATEGGYTARAVDVSIYTEADNVTELRRQIRDAVRCHFEPTELPKNDLSSIEFKKVIEYVSFLKFRTRLKAISPPPQDVSQWAKFYAEFAEADRQLAEEGMEEYTQELLKEDKK